MSLLRLLTLNAQRDACLDYLKLQRNLVTTIERIIQNDAEDLQSSEKGLIFLLALRIALPALKQAIADNRQEIQSLAEDIIFILKYKFPTMPARGLPANNATSLQHVPPEPTESTIRRQPMVKKSKLQCIIS